MIMPIRQTNRPTIDSVNSIYLYVIDNLAVAAFYSTTVFNLNFHDFTGDRCPIGSIVYVSSLEVFLRFPVVVFIAIQSG